jgi:CRP-like cAMP-binding protein
MTVAKKARGFNPHTFLSTIGEGRHMLPFKKKAIIFAQGDASDGLFFIQQGKVVSAGAKIDRITPRKGRDAAE